MNTSLIPIASIMLDAALLRPIDKESEKYQELLASVKDVGIMSPPSARPHPKEADKFIIIDGAHRFEAAKDAGLGEIPLNILDAKAEDVYRLQVIGNIQRIETKPAQLAKHLQIIMSQDTSLTQAQIAKMIHKTQAYVSSVLRLTKLPEDVQKLVDEGQISASNAFVLARLPEDEVSQWVDKARTLPPDQFGPQCTARISQLNKRLPKSEKPDPNVYIPTPIIRAKGDLLDEYQGVEDSYNPDCDKSSKDYQSGYVDGLRYALQLDAESVRTKRAEFEQELIERQNKKAEKEREKGAETAVKAAAPYLAPKGFVPAIS